MARPVTIRNILDRATKRADMTNSNFFSPQEKLDLFNELYPEMYDLLVAASENYYSESEYITVVPNQRSYELPDNYYKMIGVDFVSGNEFITIKPFMEQERNTPFSSSVNLPSGQVRLRYVPAPAYYEIADLDEEIDGVSGWDALIVVDIAIAMLQSEESDVSSLMARRSQLVKRLEEMAPNRDLGMAQRVQDIYEANYWGLGYDYLRYRFYGNNIEFMATQAIGYFT